MDLQHMNAKTSPSAIDAPSFATIPNSTSNRNMAIPNQPALYFIA